MIPIINAISATLQTRVRQPKANLLAFIAIPVILLSLFFFAISYIVPYMGASLFYLDKQWTVESVDSYGIAAAEGIRAGDTPLTVNGQPAQTFLSSFEKAGWVRIIEELTVSDSEGTTKSANIRTSSQTSGAVFDLTMWLIPCLAFWATGLWVYLKKPNNLAAILLLLCGLVFGLALSSNMASDRMIPASLHLTVIAGTIGPWLLLHFFLLLPEERAWLRNKPKQFLIYLLPGIVILAYPFIGYAEGQPLPDFRVFRLFGYALGFLSVIGVVIYNYHKAKSSKTRQQMIMVLIGCLGALIPFLIFNILPSVTTGNAFIQSNITVAFLSFIPLSLGLAVVTQKLMDIDVVIRRGVVYTLITLVMAAALTIAFTLILSAGIAPDQRFLLALVLSALAVFLLGPTKSIIEAVVDKFFYKDRFDYRKTILELSSSLSATSDTLVASSLIADAPVTAMNLAGACLFMATDNGSFEIAAARGTFDNEEKQEQLTNLMVRRATAIEFPNLAESADPEVAFIVPLVAANKEVGVLMLSPKLSKQEFTGSDLYLIQGLASVAAVSLRGLLIADRDVKQRRRHEQAILAAKQEWESTFDSIPDLICILDGNHNVVRVNRAMSEKLGLTPAETVGKKCYELMHETDAPPDSCPGLKSSHGCELGSEFSRCGSVYQINISTLKSGGKTSGRYVHIARDVTAVKNAEAEQQRLKEKAEMSSRLAAVGEMAAGIAHEINNPLTGVLGFSELVLQQDLPPIIKEDVQIIAEGSRRIADIIKRMLTFARQMTPVKTKSDLNKIIDNTLDLRGYVLLTAGIQVEKKCDPTLAWMVVDPSQMQQVFLNLMINAEHAIKKTGRPGKLTITSEMIGDKVRITFSDNGVGIEKEILPKLFQPFFTTKGPNEGTGLGLSLSRSIIVEHGGTLEVESEFGKGSSFIIELPLSLGTEEEVLTPPSSIAAPPSGKADILVIDDEEHIRGLATATLAKTGRTIDTAADAARALKLLQTRHYDVIVMDLRMPGVSGMALYVDLIGRYPGLNGRIIIITGDALGQDVKNFVAQHKLEILAKPFEPGALEQAVNRVLQSNNAAA